MYSGRSRCSNIATVTTVNATSDQLHSEGRYATVLGGCRHNRRVPFRRVMQAHISPLRTVSELVFQS